MSRVRLEVDLDELAAAIAESVKHALFAQGFTIARVVAEAVHARTVDGPCPCRACAASGELIRGLTRDELAAAFAELGNNTAGGLMLFAEDEPRSNREDRLDRLESVLRENEGYGFRDIAAAVLDEVEPK